MDAKPALPPIATFFAYCLDLVDLTRILDHLSPTVFFDWVPIPVSSHEHAPINAGLYGLMGEEYSQLQS